MELVYNAKTKKIIMLFDSPMLNMRTGQTVFKGTIKECLDKIDELGLTQDEEMSDPFMVERIFKAKTEHIDGDKIPIIPDNDFLALDVLDGIKVHEKDGYTYMKCSIPDESLKAMLDNSGEDDLNANVVMNLGIIDAYVGETTADIPV